MSFLAFVLADSSVPSTTDFADTRLRDELVRQKRELDAEREALRERDVRFNEERMELDAAKAAFAADKEAAVAAALAAHAEETAKAAAAAEAEARAREDAVPLPPRSPKHRHHPASPSPLSPHRSPAKIAAGARRRPPRTPLSRLVLERATLDRERRKARLGGSLRSSTRSVSGKSAGPSSHGVGPAGGPSEAGSSASGASAAPVAPAGPTGPAASRVLSDSGRDNFLAPADKGKGKMEASLRKSSTLLSSTAAARARAADKGKGKEKEDERVKDRARGSMGSTGSGSSRSSTAGKARAWR